MDCRMETEKYERAPEEKKHATGPVQPINETEYFSIISKADQREFLAGPST